MATLSTLLIFIEQERANNKKSLVEFAQRWRTQIKPATFKLDLARLLRAQQELHNMRQTLMDMYGAK